MKTWELREAKAHLREVIKQASKEGPQTITMCGTSTAVIISTNDYERLKHPRGSFVSFMRKSLFCGIELDATREQTRTRETDIA